MNGSDLLFMVIPSTIAFLLGMAFGRASMHKPTKLEKAEWTLEARQADAERRQSNYEKLG